jgi:hypothetical protein
MVGVERPQLRVRLAFCLRLDLLDGNRYMILGGDRGYPHIPVEIIYKQQEVLVPPTRRWCN